MENGRGAIKLIDAKRRKHERVWNVFWFLTKKYKRMENELCNYTHQ